MSLFVATTLILAGGCGVRWSRTILSDEDRYLRAIEPLAGSPAFTRIACCSVSFATRRRLGWHRTGWRSAIPTRCARLASSATRRSMSTAAFGHAWVRANRTLHRRRPARRPRVAAAMVALAAMGSLIGATGRFGVER